MSVDRDFRDLPDSFDPPAQVVAPPQPRRCCDFAWPLAIAAGVWLFGAILAMSRIVPKFGEIYAQVKVPLPSWTEAVLAVSRAVVQWPFPCVLLAAAVSVSAGFLKGPAKKAVPALLPIAIVLTIGWIAGGLFLPFIGTLEGIGQGRR